MDKEIIDLIIRWEEEGLPEDEHIKLFKSLVESGAAWGLQGMYGREAIRLMQEGLIETPDLKTIPPRARMLLEGSNG
jgi:hypothetical protein